MQEIKCPKCSEVFQVDESGYAAIVKQVRDREFEKELLQHKSSFDSEKENAVRIAILKTESEKDKIIEELRQKLALSDANTEAEMERLRSESSKRLAEKESEITRLESRIEIDRANSDMAVEKAMQEKQSEIMQLKNDLRLEQNKRELNERH